MNRYKLVISFRARHNTETSDDIVQRFKNILPSRSWRARPKLDHPAAPSGAYVSFEIDVDPQSSPEAAFEALAKSLIKAESAIEAFKVGGGGIDIFVGFFFEENSGFTIHPEVSRALYELGISISFDIYGSID